MRSINIYKCLVFILLVLVIWECALAQDPQKLWDYPVRPGTPEWKLLGSFPERLKACHIPNDILSSVSTDQLIDICINYPLVLNILAFNSILDGFKNYTKNCNGFQELLKRDNVTTVLINKYKIENPLIIDTELTSFKDRFGFAVRLSMLELFLCHEQILSKLDHTQKVDLVKELQYKKSQKYNSNPLYRDIGLQTVSLAIILLIENEEFSIDQNIDIDLIYPYIISGIIFSERVFEEIDKVVNNYITKQN